MTGISPFSVASANNMVSLCQKELLYGQILREPISVWLVLDSELTGSPYVLHVSVLMSLHRAKSSSSGQCS